MGLDQLWHRLPLGYLLCLLRREVGTDRAMGAADACRARAMSRGMRRSREIWSGDRMQGEDAEYAPAMDARGVAAIAMQRDKAAAHERDGQRIEGAQRAPRSTEGPTPRGGCFGAFLSVLVASNKVKSFCVS